MHCDHREVSKCLIRAVIDQNDCVDAGHEDRTLADYSTRQSGHVKC